MILRKVGACIWITRTVITLGMLHRPGIRQQRDHVLHHAGPVRRRRGRTVPRSAKWCLEWYVHPEAVSRGGNPLTAWEHLHLDAPEPTWSPKMCTGRVVPRREDSTLSVTVEK